MSNRLQCILAVGVWFIGAGIVSWALASPFGRTTNAVLGGAGGALIGWGSSFMFCKWFYRS